MTSIVDVNTNAVIVRSCNLPYVFEIPEGGQAKFFSEGGELSIDGVLRYKSVETVVLNSPPGPLYSPIGETVSYDQAKSRVTINIVYPEQPNVVPPVEVIRTAYLKAALAQMGKLATVEAAISDPVLKALWDAATEMRRDDPDMIALASALSIDIEAVWTAARAIRDARATR